MPMPTILDPGDALPEVVIGYVSVRSQGGESFLDADDLSDAEPFYGKRADDTKATQASEQAGLEILAESRLGKAVAGPPEAYEELTGGTLVTVERLMHTRAGREEYVTHIDIVGSGQPDALGVGTGRPRPAAPGRALRSRRPRSWLARLGCPPWRARTRPARRRGRPCRSRSGWAAAPPPAPLRRRLPTRLCHGRAGRGSGSCPARR